MIACPLCDRLRRPVGMHICVPGLRTKPQRAPAPVDVQTSGHGNLRSFRLPDQWAAASVWNALIEGKTP